MEQPFSEAQALKVIRQSIEQTKETFREKGLVFLILGWVVFLTAIVNFFLIKFKIDDGETITFMVLVFASFAPTIYSWWTGTIRTSPFYPDMTKPSLYHLWWGFSYVMLVILFFDSRTNGQFTLPYMVIISLLGLAAYVTGAMLKFKPFIIGGYLSIWPLAILSINIYIRPHLEYQLLMLAASVLCSFIIPAHLLRASK